MIPTRKAALVSAVALACIQASSELKCCADQPAVKTSTTKEIQVTDRPSGHILTNANVWSPDGRWIVYDTRSDPAGENFDGQTIEIVNVDTREVREIYRSRNGAHCGVATFSPTANKVVFILGPESPTSDWQYSAWHRQGVTVEIEQPGRAVPLDARDLTYPFTPGALRGGTHVHVFSGDGEWISFTYEDHLLAALDSTSGQAHDFNQRNVGISAPVRPIKVASDHPRNHNGSMFSVLVTSTVNDPRPGSDEISRACEDAWIGTQGYIRPDGTRQHRAIAFQGLVKSLSGAMMTEVFAVDIPDDVTVSGEAPLEGTGTTRPGPPRATRQRRLTYTANRKYPGLQGPRHWLRSSPDGSRIAFLMRDDAGVVQIWTISPNGGEPEQLTNNPFDVASAFSWDPGGQSIAYVADNSVFMSDVTTKVAVRLTKQADKATSPRPEACVFSPDGKRIAFIRSIDRNGLISNQIFIVHR